MNDNEDSEDPLTRAFLTAVPVLRELAEPGMLDLPPLGWGGGHVLPGSRPPLNIDAIDARAKVAALLGADREEPLAQLSAVYAARDQLTPEQRKAATTNALKATAAGRCFLAKQRGHTLRKCPACRSLTLIPLEDERGLMTGVLECQNDECADETGQLRRFSLRSRLPGDPYAQVTVAEVAAFTGISIEVWDARLRRHKAKPVGKRYKPGRGRPERLFEWQAFLEWVNPLHYETVTALHAVPTG